MSKNAHSIEPKSQLILETSVQDISWNISPSIEAKALKYSPRLSSVGQVGKLWKYEVNQYDVLILFSEDPMSKDASVIDIKVNCSCPFHRWQGPEHWGTNHDYQLGPLRGTASEPVIRDPDHEKPVCKHIWATLQDIIKRSGKSKSFIFKGEEIDDDADFDDDYDDGSDATEPLNENFIKVKKMSAREKMLVMAGLLKESSAYEDDMGDDGPLVEGGECVCNTQKPSKCCPVHGYAVGMFGGGEKGSTDSTSSLVGSMTSTSGESMGGGMVGGDAGGMGETDMSSEYHRPLEGGNSCGSIPTSTSMFGAADSGSCSCPKCGGYDHEKDVTKGLLLSDLISEMQEEAMEHMKLDEYTLQMEPPVHMTKDEMARMGTPRPPQPKTPSAADIKRNTYKSERVDKARAAGPEALAKLKSFTGKDYNKELKEDSDLPAEENVQPPEEMPGEEPTTDAPESGGSFESVLANLEGILGDLNSEEPEAVPEMEMMPEEVPQEAPSAEEGMTPQPETEEMVDLLEGDDDLYKEKLSAHLEKMPMSQEDKEKFLAHKLDKIRKDPGEKAKVDMMIGKISEEAFYESVEGAAAKRTVERGKVLREHNTMMKIAGLL